MSEQTLTTSLSRSAGESLRLEQVPWDAHLRTYSEYLQWLEDNGYTVDAQTAAIYWQTFMSPCDNDGCIYPQVRVYTAPAGLPYVLRQSYGIFGTRDADGEFSAGQHRRIESEARSESIEWSLAASVELRFVDALTSCEWEGEVYLADGTALAPPPAVAMVDGRLILTDAEGVRLRGDNGDPTAVDGTLRVGYTVSYDLHTLMIVPRDVSDEEEQAEGFDRKSLYQATVRAFFSGRIEKMTIDPPSLDKINSCPGNAGVTTVIDPGGADEVSVLIEPYDYCVGDTITAECCIYVNGLPVGPDRQVTVVRGETNEVRIVAPGYVASDEDRLLANDTFVIPLEDAA